MRRRVLAVVAIALVTVASVLSRSGDGTDSRTGGGMRQQAIGALHPRISPAGDSIVFSYQGAIWRISRTGGTMTRLTSGDGFDMEPAWSPDGQQIAFINSRNFYGGEVRQIHLADGSSSTLGKAVTAQGKLQFHSDGRRILGKFQLSGQPESLSWLDRETGELKPVLSPARPARRPALSHDGRWIAFITTLDVPGEQTGNDGAQNDLWKVSADGGEPEQIARFPARIYDTCWDNDGQSIFVTTDRGGAYYDIWRVPLADPLRAARAVTYGQADEDRPSLSSDGRWLVYTDNRVGATALVVRDLQRGDEQTLTVSALDFGKPSGSLRLKVVDKATGRPIVARVALHEKPGKFHAPAGSLYRIERGSGHFYCRSQGEIELPAGTHQLRAYCGPEYRSTHRDIRIEPAKTTTETIELERWEDFSSHGYWSGENHIHANYGYGEWYNTPQSMLDQCEGENLNVCNFMVANSDGDGVFDRSFFSGQPDALSTPTTVLYWNQEFRSTIWGHMTLVALRQVVEPVFTGFKGTTNPWDIPTNADIADRTHLQRGLVNYTHPAQNVDDPYLGPYTAKGLPVDVALGKIDSLDVMGSSHRATVPLWYRLLNCGFRLPASAGTDCFLNRVRSRLPGSDRAYVTISGEFSYSAWIAGLRAGKSFVTNGPIVEMVVDGELRQGQTLELDGPRAVRVVGRARSQFPLQRVEVVYNGRVVATQEASEHSATMATVDQMIDLDRSGWLAVRTNGPAHADHTSSELYAHTSPVYVRVQGRLARARSDAQYFLAWIDRLNSAVQQRDRIPSPELKAHVESQLEAARAIYRRVAKDTE